MIKLEENTCKEGGLHEEILCESREQRLEDRYYTERVHLCKKRVVTSAAITILDYSVG